MLQYSRTEEEIKYANTHIIPIVSEHAFELTKRGLLRSVLCGAVLVTYILNIGYRPTS